MNATAQEVSEVMGQPMHCRRGSQVLHIGGTQAYRPSVPATSLDPHGSVS